MSYYEDDGPIVVTPPQQIEIETENGTTLVSGSHGTAAPVVGNAPKTSREYTYTRADIKQFAREEVNESIDEVVEANPALAGTEADLTGLKVGDTKYKVPTGTNVEANPTLAGTESDLEGLEVGETKYKVPPRVSANPTLDGTEAVLEAIQIATTKYKVGGGSSGQKYLHLLSFSIYDDLNYFYICGVVNTKEAIYTGAELFNDFNGQQLRAIRIGSEPNLQNNVLWKPLNPQAQSTAKITVGGSSSFPSFKGTSTTYQKYKTTLTTDGSTITGTTTSSSNQVATPSFSYITDLVIAL